jgi:hypothetical protein
MLTHELSQVLGNGDALRPRACLDRLHPHTADSTGQRLYRTVAPRSDASSSSTR